MTRSEASQPADLVCRRIALAGLGRDGAAIVHALDSLPAAVNRLYLTASPTQAIAESPALLRLRATDDWEEGLRAALAETQMLVLVAAITSREGTFAPAVMSLARELGTLAVAVLVEPLLAASPHRSEAALQMIKDVTRTADATIVVPAALHPLPSLSISEAISRWNQRLAESLCGLLATASSEDALNMDFADVAAVFAQHCRATVGVGTGETVEEALRDAARQCLAPAVELETASTVLAHVIVGSDIPLEDAHRAGPILEQLFPKAQAASGISVNQSLPEVHATLLAGRLDPAAVTSEKRRTTPAESPFFKVGDPSVYEGENLDIPAFVRQDITLPGGPPRLVPAQKTLFEAPAAAKAVSVELPEVASEQSAVTSEQSAASGAP